VGQQAQAVESWRTRLTRWGFNIFPAYRGAGGRITFIRHDWSELRVELRLSWRTRNYVGTLFGGSIYGAVDPIYMIMLIKRLGPGYVVWDKAAAIRFRHPGRGTLFASFAVDDALVEGIRAELGRTTKLERVFSIELVDRAGVVHATVEKTIHVSRRDGAAAVASRAEARGGEP
jgi:acyl-coenzyme A thioesterase PaaI-like protein